MDSHDIAEKIKHNIERNKEAYLEFLKNLVSYDSHIIQNGVCGMEKDIQDFLKAEFSGMGAKVDAFEPENERISKYPGFNAGHEYAGRENVVATFKGAGHGRSLLLNGHCDIVTPGDEDKWSSPPFLPEVRDGKLYGRGTVDMKGGLAAAILAIKLLLDMGYSFAGDIIVTSVVDEEGGGNGTLACCERGYRADAALIMEPTSLVIMAANRGTFLARFTVQGKPIHSSMRGHGVNAIDKAFKLISALREIETNWLLTKRHPLLSNPLINIGQIQGGSGASVVPEDCTVSFSAEFFPTDYDEDGNMSLIDPEDIKVEIQSYIDIACKGDPWLSEHPVKIDWYQETLCFQTDTNHDFVREAVKCVDSIVGNARVSGLPSGCDGAHLANVGKMPVVILGPGDIKEAHTIDESINVEEFYKAIELYASLITNWVGIE